MSLNSITVLLPIFFVLGLGYVAGRTKKFDADQVQGISYLVLHYAMPAMMFVATVSTRRSEMFAEGPFLMALLGAFVGLFVVAVLFSVFVLHHSLGEAALQANLISYPSVAFIGPPIFRGLFGGTSIFSIASAAVLCAVTVVPLTVALAEIHGQRKASSAAGSPDPDPAALIASSLWKTIKQPMVLLPAIGVALVLADVRIPQVIDNMLMLIGSATSGASIFLAGLIVAAYRIKIDFEIVGNVLVKMVGQPALMALLVASIGVANPLGREGVLICAIPTAVFAPLIAPHYKVYEAESASTLVLTALLMIVTLPLTILLTGA
jgi:malonate transporter and related proteins